MYDEIGVNAVQDHHWPAWFDGLEVSNDDRGQTTIAGSVVDPGSLHGLLARLMTEVWSC